MDSGFGGFSGFEKYKRRQRHRRRLRRMRRGIVLPLVLTLGLVSGGLVLGFVAIPPVANAAMAVVDSSAVAKLSSQLNELKKQFQELAKVNAQLQGTLNAIGEVGRIVLPIVNLDKLKDRFEKDLQCMVPDFLAMMPSLDFEEIDFGSICETRAFYEEALFVEDAVLKKVKDGAAKNRLRDEVQERRRALLRHAVTTSLAQADQNQKNAEELNKASDDLERAVKTAKNQNERLAAIGQGHVINARAQAKIIQILSQMQQADAAFYMEAGVDLNTTAKAKDKEAKKTGGRSRSRQKQGVSDRVAP